MKIEHVAWPVEDADAVAQWYVDNLGMKIIRQAGNARFLADSTDRTLLEIYSNPQVETPDYRNTHPLIIHLAFAVEDVAAEKSRLLAAGAKVAEDIKRTEQGDEMVMLRDPWGFPLQLLSRKIPM